MRLNQAVRLVESQAVHLSSPDPVVRQTAREAVRCVLVAYRDSTRTVGPPPADTPEQIAVRRRALIDLVTHRR
jgi:hypothetical protein